MDILKFLLNIADDLTDAEFENCNIYLDLPKDGPEIMSYCGEENCCVQG
jgi:hypothetical protein